MYFAVVGLGTGGVDLAAHFLGYETELLAGIGLLPEGLEVVGAVLAQAYPFLVDVQLLKVLYHLLLQSFRLRAGAYLRKAGEYALTHGFAAFLLVFLYLA